ncbi:hypothetical protein QIS74_01755 [Colletotrichum tabaci]|uniref:Uncharacterized protein n=1 Tax=Colletotrichum tabaci TaxID=1209068 RepID=A0AAV9TRK1_9PEZI
MANCQPATFGLNNKDVLDDTYRKAGKINERRFCTKFNPYEHGIIDTVSQSLANIDNASKHQAERPGRSVQIERGQLAVRHA